MPCQMIYDDDGYALWRVNRWMKGEKKYKKQASER